MGLMDILRAGVKGTAAARAGYLAGAEEGKERTKRDALTAIGLTRQSRLDQIAAERAAAQARRDEAQAGYYERRDASRAEAPHTLATDKGIMQWDTASRSFKPTGLKAPARASDAAAVRTEQRAARQQTKDAATGVERQIDNTRAELRDLGNDVGLDQRQLDSATTVKKSRLDSLTKVSDSLNAEVQRPGSGAKLSAAPGSRMATLTGSTANPAQGMYDDAADAYRQALREAKTPAEKAQAKALYDRAVAAIARKHGQVKGPVKGQK